MGANCFNCYHTERNGRQYCDSPLTEVGDLTEEHLNYSCNNWDDGDWDEDLDDYDDDDD